MAKLKIQMKSGETVELTGQRFALYIMGERFWFFLHRSTDTNGYSVTHYDSGKRVLQITTNSILACLGDKKAAAKLELDRLIERAGAARVRSVLAAG